MAYTLGNIVTLVQQRVRDTGYSSSEIKQYINDAQNDVCNEYPFFFTENTQAYTLTPNVSDITNGVGLPAGYVQTIDLFVTSTGLEGVLPYRNVTLSDEFNPDQDDQPANFPQYWYKFGSTIKIYPKPASAYTVSLRYYKTPTELSDNTDVPVVPAQFKELLVVGAAYRVLQVKDNYDQAGILQNKFDEILQKMVVKLSQVQTAQPFIMPVNKITTTGNF